MSRLISAGRAATGSRAGVRESTTFLSSLGEFCRLLDARELPHGLEASAATAVLLGSPYFDLPQTPRAACSFEPVCGGTWGQGMLAMLELATRAADWAESRGHDPHDGRLVSLWQEGIGLAWAAELTARCQLMPAPYLAWEAGLLLVAVALNEHLRLLECSDTSDVCLGGGATRQLESLVIQYDFSPALSLAGTLRKGSYVGPWPVLASAYRLAVHQADFYWASSLLESIESLPLTRVMEGCVRRQVADTWAQSLELSRRGWLTGVSTARRQRSS